MSRHLDAAHEEIDRIACLYARLTRDAFKGGWTGIYDMPGGPAAFPDGGGHSMSPGLMRRLMLVNLAAGNVNMAFRAWSAPPGGALAAELGLTTRSGDLSAWAAEAGKVARAIQRYIGELWEAVQDVQAAILRHWDNEAILWLEAQRRDPGGRSAGTRGVRRWCGRVSGRRGR